MRDLVRDVEGPCPESPPASPSQTQFFIENISCEGLGEGGDKNTQTASRDDLFNMTSFFGGKFWREVLVLNFEV